MHEIKKKIKHISVWLTLILLCAGCARTKTGESAPAVTEAALTAAPALTAEPTNTPVPEIAFVVLTPAPEVTREPEVPATQEPFQPEETAAPAESGNREKFTAGAGVTTVAWISDTQHYANTFPEIYPTITGFLYEHRKDMNLAYVIHTGDLVHRNGDEENWVRAKDAMDLLRDIPFGVLAGNHDMAESGGGYAGYSRWFGEQRFSDKPYYGASFQNNRGHYDLLTVGDTDYIFVYMSFEPDTEAIRFMTKAFLDYPDRVGILCVHDFITTEGTLSEAGNTIRDRVLKNCPNCYMVLCGHRYGLYCLKDGFDDDGDGVFERTVYEMMMNYQAAGKEGGSGYFRLMQFDDAAGEIRVLTYSEYLHDYNWLDDPAHNEPRYMMDETSEEFVLTMPWRVNR